MQYLLLPNQNVLIDVYRDGDLLQFPVRVGSSEDIDGNQIGIIGVSFGTSRSCINLCLKAYMRHTT